MKVCGLDRKSPIWSFASQRVLFEESCRWPTTGPVSPVAPCFCSQHSRMHPALRWKFPHNCSIPCLRSPGFVAGVRPTGLQEGSRGLESPGGEPPEGAESGDLLGGSSGTVESSRSSDSVCSAENEFFVSTSARVEPLLSEPDSMAPGAAIHPPSATRLFSCCGCEYWCCVGKGNPPDPLICARVGTQ